MRITLVVPGLLALAPDVLAQADALSQLAALATPTAVVDLDAAVLAEHSITAAVGPVAALGAGIDLGPAWVIRADPVSILVGRDDVRLAGLVDNLDPIEGQTLLTLLAPHFDVDGLAFAAARTDAWFAISAAAHDVTTTPLDAAIGRPLRTLLPVGADAARWRRWLTETQMLLHEHPLAERPMKPVNGMWFSGGGVLPDRSRSSAIRAHAAAGRHGDVARGLSRLGGRDADTATSLDDALRDALDADRVLVVLAPVRSAVALDAAMRSFVAPALDRVHHGDASELTLLADGPRMAARWHTRRPSLLKRIARRRASFVPPSGES